MKITNNNPVIPPDQQAIERDSSRAAQKPVQHEDRVELSNTAGVTDPSRAGRIEQLSAAVKNGTYKVSPEDIASSIIDEMLGK